MAPKIPAFRVEGKTAFYTGLFLGGIAGLFLSAGVSFLYLLASQDTVTVKNGQMTFNKPITTITEAVNPSTTGNRNAVSGSNGVSNTGANSEVARDPKDSFNRKDSPSIVGNNNVINIAPSRDLPGFDEKLYRATPPSDLSKYSKVSDFQPDSLIQSASDTEKIKFEKKEIVILGKPYMSFFDVNWYANDSRFVFKLDGTQKAALLQFGLPDLPTGRTTVGLYTVKISADGKLLWAGECRRSQGNQIISVPIDIVGKTTLTIEATSNGKNESDLYFTEARILK